MAKSNEWLCVNCSHPLGTVEGGELVPAVQAGVKMQTRGPNLVVTCPHCQSQKTWYTADPIVRAVYQLIDSMVSLAAKRMLQVISDATVDPEEFVRKYGRNS